MVSPSPRTASRTSGRGSPELPPRRGPLEPPGSGLVEAKKSMDSEILLLENP